MIRPLLVKFLFLVTCPLTVLLQSVSKAHDVHVLLLFTRHPRLLTEHSSKLCNGFDFVVSWKEAIRDQKQVVNYCTCNSGLI